jgi:curved DNA-binding protein CbpA
VEQPARKNYYAVLGVPRDADGNRVREAFRRLVRRYHPDINPGDPAAESRIKEINEAYDVLSDPEKRRKYNVLGADWEAILRDEHLRRRTSSGPRSSSSDASQAFSGAGDVWTATLRASAGPTWPSLGAIPRRGWVVIVSLMMLSCGLVLSHRYSARRAEAVHKKQVGLFWEATNRIRALQGQLSSFSGQLAKEGIEVWVKFCPERTLEEESFLERTLQPNFEKRYRAAARQVIEEVTRAESAGVFSLPLPPGDLVKLRSALALREALRLEDRREHLLQCDAEQVVDDLKHHAVLAQTAAGCLDQLSRLGAEKVWTIVESGQAVCAAAAAGPDGA